MSLASDLLLQAQHLASRDQGKPKQANLRRAVSSADYALFHLLVFESAKLLSPKRPAGLAARVSRAYAHDEMKQVCRSISEGNPSAIMLELHPERNSADLRSLAKALLVLQEARHAADYDITVTFSRADVFGFIGQTEAAFASFRRIRAADETTVFLTALLLNKRWSR